MTKTKQPTLRYFARFKGELGVIHAVVRYGLTRKTISTPLVIQRYQLPYFNSAGAIITDAKITPESVMLDARCREYTKAVWSVVTPMIKAGTFADVPGAELSRSIMDVWMQMQTNMAGKVVPLRGGVPSATAPNWIDNTNDGGVSHE